MAWVGNLRYHYREAHHLRITDAQAELQFVTQIDPRGFFLTGSVTVLPAAG